MGSCSKDVQEIPLTECQFADDMALLATTRLGAEKAMKEYQLVCRSFGLSVSIPKTKCIVTGKETSEEDKTLVPVDGGEVEQANEFLYLGSLQSQHQGGQKWMLKGGLLSHPKLLVPCTKLSSETTI